MASNNFKLFDENKGNMLTDSEYSTNSQRQDGVQAGVASSKLNNKFAYQVSLVAYAIAQVMNANGLDALDSDSVTTFVANLSSALVQKVADRASASDAEAGTSTTKFLTPSVIKNMSLVATQIPNLDASKITSGTLPIARGGTGATTADNACSNIGAVKKSGDTMTGNLSVSKSSYPQISAIDTTQARKAMIEYSSGGAVSIQNRSTDDDTNYSSIWLDVESSALNTLLRVGQVESGTRTTYNVLHTGNYTDYVVPKTGGTFSGLVSVSKSSYPQIAAIDTTQDRRAILEYGSNATATIINRLGNDNTNGSYINLNGESSELITLLRVGQVKSGTRTTYNVLHTGNVTSSTTDITAGTTALATGAQYLVYE